MNAIKLYVYSGLILMLPLSLWGQQKENTPFPKDTVYIKYTTSKTADSWNAKFERAYNKHCGLYFNIEDPKGGMTLFHDYKTKADTLPKEALKHIQFSNLKEINRKRRSWVFDHNRPPLTKSRIFQTYVIEVISDTQVVRYPVIWRNEGATP